MAPAKKKAKAKAKSKAKASTKPKRSRTKTAPTAVSVDAFIDAVDNDTRRADARVLLKLLREVTGWKPKMWGPTIIGFGAYQYTYDSGHSGSICALGFSPRDASQVIYVADFPGKEQLLASLGKHKGGLKQCLYINKLADVDLGVLRSILEGGLAQIKREWPVTPE
jgi:hypothetical protein